MAERILVVDDEEAILEIVSSMLAHASYQCQTASSGNEALALLRSGEPFDLILSGVMMPGIDGVVLLERTIAEFPAIPLVFVTGVYDHSVVLYALRSGAYGYLNKPFWSDELLATIRLALETHRFKTRTHEDRSNLDLLVAGRIEQVRKTLSELERTDEESLGNAWHLLDKQGEPHRRFVTAHSIAVARAMNLPEEQISVIARGAFLHDIGQVQSLRDALLQPEILSPDELAILSRCCDDTYEILKSISCLADHAEIVYAYQERFDGTGYPRRLKGEQIPLGARIVTVVHTMTTEMWEARSQHFAQDVASAQQEIQRRSGVQLDPEIVKTVLSMPADVWK